MTLLRNAYPGEGASARLQRLGDSVDTVDVIHEGLVYCLRGFAGESAPRRC